LKGNGAETPAMAQFPWRQSPVSSLLTAMPVSHSLTSAGQPGEWRRGGEILRSAESGGVAYARGCG
jgi:hypothetical protein